MQDENALDILDNMNGRTPFGLLYKKNRKDDSGLTWALTMGTDNIEPEVAKRLVAMLLKLDSFFMPASRNGLMLLYREFLRIKQILCYLFRKVVELCKNRKVDY